MRPALCVLSLLLLLPACSDSREPRQPVEKTDGFPATFDSVDAAQKWIRGRPTGGRVDEVRLGWRRHLVVFQHGSGFPVTGIGLYRRNLFSWELISEHRPPHPPVGILRAEARDGKIVLISMPPSGRIWPLSEPE